MRDDPVIIKGTLPLNEPIILNNDYSDGGGIHWMCLLDNGKTLFVYDPLSNDVSPVLQELKQYCKRNKRQLMITPYAHQHIKSNMCGYYSLYMANLMRKTIKKGIDITPQLFKDLVIRSFGRRPDKQDVLRCLRWYYNTQ
jgi:hypothetical protein